MSKAPDWNYGQIGDAEALAKAFVQKTDGFYKLRHTVNAIKPNSYGLKLQYRAEEDIPTIPGELFAKFQTSFYADPADAVFKALGVQ